MYPSEPSISLTSFMTLTLSPSLDLSFELNTGTNRIQSLFLEQFLIYIKLDRWYKVPIYAPPPSFPLKLLMGKWNKNILSVSIVT